MIAFVKPAAFALAAALLTTVAASSVGAADRSYAPHVLKANRGISLDLGSKKVAGYYLDHQGVCDVTLMVGDLADADGTVEPGITRINVPVSAGAKTQVYLADGKAIEIACGLKSNVMTVRALEQTAAIKN